MKNLISVIFMLLLLQAQVSAKSCTISSYTWLKGKYQFELNYQEINKSYSIYLKNNLPGIYHVEMAFKTTDRTGEEHEEMIHVQQAGSEVLLFKSMLEIEQLTLQKFSITYNQYGEEYRIQWDQTSGFMRFSKQGKEYNYANPYTLCATDFYWPHENRLKDQIIPPVESCKLSAK